MMRPDAKKLSCGSILLAAVSAVFFSLALHAADLTKPASDSPSLIERGEAVYAENCMPCHGYGYGTDGAKVKPAVAALQIKYQGNITPYLEERSDMSAELLQYFIRNGVKAMPAFRKTEVMDSDINAIAAYLKFKAAQSKQ